MATPPQLTPEQRANALVKAAEARVARAELKNKLKMGTVTLAEHERYGLEEVGSSSPPAVANGVVVVGSSVIARNGRLYYANFDGVVACHNIERDEMEWRYGVRGSIVADPVVDGEYLYVVSSGGDVVKLSLRGDVEWSVNLGGPVGRSPIVMGQDLYVLSRRVFYVFDTARGTVQWSIVMPTESATNIAVSGRTMYFGTEGNGIYQIRK